MCEVIHHTGIFLEAVSGVNVLDRRERGPVKLFSLSSEGSCDPKQNNFYTVTEKALYGSSVRIDWWGGGISAGSRDFWAFLVIEVVLRVHVRFLDDLH